MLLSGCVSSLWMPEAYQAARLLLERWGFVVDVPEQALCCGALARHAGDVETAEILRHELLETIPPSQPVLVLDSGCFGATHAICTLPGRTTQPVYELTAFLDAHCPPDFAPKLARPARVALHVPCTQRSEVRDAHAATRLLARVGQLTLQPLELAHGCCGAAGSYLLRETHMSDTLAATLRSALGEELPDAIVTTNIGCRLQWQSELGRAGLSIPVRHPAEILLGMRSGIGTDGQMTESVGRPAVPYGKA